MIITRRSGAYVTGYQLETANACSIVNLEGDVLGADPLFLQIHNTVGAPANAAVPIRSMRLVAGNGFRWYHAPELVDLPSGGIYIVLSTTEATFTATATTMNLFVDIEDYLGAKDGDLSTKTVAGDLVTSVVSLNVWTEAQGPKTLIKLDLSNSTGAALYAQIFARDVNAEGSVPLRSLSVPISGAFIAFSFGSNSGWVPTVNVAGVNYYSCQVKFSTTQWTLTSPGNSGTIRATYV